MAAFSFFFKSSTFFVPQNRLNQVKFERNGFSVVFVFFYLTMAQFHCDVSKRYDQPFLNCGSWGAQGTAFARALSALLTRMEFEGVLAQCCNPLTWRSEQSGREGLILDRAPLLERHDKGSRT